MSRAAAFQVVDQFEAALCEYTGAMCAVAVDSCTNALHLCFKYVDPPTVWLPKHTYVGVRQAAVNAGVKVQWRDKKWQGWYQIRPTNIIDSAKRFERDMYQPGTLTCLSFQAGKLLPIGRGGAILTDDKDAAEWFKRARLDGRTAGVDYQHNTYQAEGWHCYLDPPSAARGLWLMTYLEDGPDDTWESYPDLSEATWN